MRKLLIKIVCAIITFSVGVAAQRIAHFSSRPATQLPPASVVETCITQAVQPAQDVTSDDEILFSDLLAEDETTRYNGYLIENRYKEMKGDIRGQQGYVFLSKNRMRGRSFNAGFYFKPGNAIGFGLFSFLGTPAKQLAISQDVPRGGAQWIVDLRSTPRVIFDGPAWKVGREGDDCVVDDLEGDGVFEISLPITDFYDLMDKMSIGQIPLPSITFKYDPVQRQYVPINHLLNNIGTSGDIDPARASDEFYLRSTILRHMLDLIYQGQRHQAWEYFDRTYNLDDKLEIERRIKDILRDQPVYKYIYKQ